VKNENEEGASTQYQALLGAPLADYGAHIRPLPTIPMVDTKTTSGAFEQEGGIYGAALPGAERESGPALIQVDRGLGGEGWTGVDKRVDR
jgi:hypothetical protein